MNTEAILAERKATHGSFSDNARISQALKRMLHAEPTWLALTEIQKEAIDMFCLKLSRIMSGQAATKDHWDDLAGYAILASKEIEK